MGEEEKRKAFLKLIEKARSVTEISDALEISELEVLGLVNEFKEKGNNISVKRLDDNIYLFNQGEKELLEYSYNFNTDENHEFKFILIADTRLGSKYQQLSILNDIYRKGREFGFNNVILCGNISAGIYPVTDIYGDTNFIHDTMGQINYIVENYPRVEGMKTYFITGKVDDSHIRQNKINIGKHIESERDDMIYLGDYSCNVEIDKTKVQLLSSRLAKTYTTSYRSQQQIDSYRSENKPDILLYGGSLQMEKYSFRNVKCITVPSVCATTREMNDKRYANTIGAWYVDVLTNEKGELVDVKAFNSPYYVTALDDYLTAKPLVVEEVPNSAKKTKKKSKSLSRRSFHE